MAGNEHEALIHMFHNRPHFAAELLSEVLGVPIPNYSQARLTAAECTEITPTEYRADAVVVLSDDEPRLAVVVEVQRGPDPAKRWSWPVYLTTVRARLKCPAMLLVVCPTNRVARWCTERINLGHPGLVLDPLVLAPAQVPLIAEPADAVLSPELAVLSGAVHGADPRHGEKALDAAFAAFMAVDQDAGQVYADYLLSLLPQAARQYLEGLMKAGKYEYKSDFARRYYGEGEAKGRAEGKAEGKAEGEAQALLLFLSARDIAVSPETKNRIMACTDLDQLGKWIRRAATVTSAEELFD